MLNPAEKPALLRFAIEGAFAPARASFEVVASGTLQARNDLEARDRVRAETPDATLEGKSVLVNVPGLSAGVITLEQ